MGEDKIFFPFFEFLGYQKMEKLRDKPKKEIFFILVTVGLVFLRTALSLNGLKSGDVDAMKFSLYLNLIPVLQTVLLLLRKGSELYRKRTKEFKGVYGATNIIKNGNPFFRRLFMVALILSMTIIASILYFLNYSSSVEVVPYLLELVVWIYMIVSTVDGVIEQLIALFSVEV